MFDYNTIIRIKQKRYICNDCNKTFNMKLSIVEKGCSISNTTKLKVMDEAKTKQSFKDISKRLNISCTSTINTFTNSSSISRNRLSEIICIDEFKANTEHGKYAFTMGNPVTGEIIDVLASRTQEYVFHYFDKIPTEEKNKVKYFITDMYESYRTVKKTMFKNAIHIVDRFHWIRLCTKALNDLRIRIMKLLQKEYNASVDTDYKRELTLYMKAMKKYGKLILANIHRKEETYFDTLVKIPNASEEMTRQRVIELIVNCDSELENGYSLLQDLYKISIFSNEKNAKDNLLEWMDKAKETKIKEFNEVCKSYKSWIDEIVNSFIIDENTKKRLTNGFIEGKNNLCKVIKRIGFGYKRFDLLRNRILYISNQNQSIKI